MDYYVVMCGAQVLVRVQNASGKIIAESNQRIKSGRIFSDNLLINLTKKDGGDEFFACFFNRKIENNLYEYWHVNLDYTIMEEDIEKAALLREDIHVDGCECEFCDDGFIRLDDMNKFIDVVLSENPDDCWIDDMVILERNKLRLKIVS
jgi:hypothetical protein